VATLLHLSDLHLGTGDDEHFGDHKLEVIAKDQRESRSQMLRSSLVNLGRSLKEHGEELDAIVVSGDVTYQGNSDGLSKLDETLNALGDSRPANGRIVVVPGNHDVAWDTEPGSLDRYAAFIEHIRGTGFVTPVLEGVDPDPADLDRGVLVATDESFIVVALNSADHCGVRQQVELDDQAALDEVEASGSAAAKRVRSMWRKASLFDVARVSAGQREHGSRALEAALAKDRRDPRVVPLRIATFHHQLLPISLDEEIKPFEALTNLAQVRDWMADNDIQLVLHGHKHVAHTYVDDYVTLARSGNARPRRLVVSSVGTIGLGQLSENTVARLIRVDPNRTRLGKVEFVDVPSSRPGMTVELTPQGRRHLMRVDGADGPEIVGRSVDDVHEQIVERLEAGVDLVGPLVCRIEDPSDADQPSVPLRVLMRENVADVDEWFKDTVELWQRDEPYSAMDFNHGERLLKHEGTVDLVEKVAEALISERETSRGVISLLDHSSDDVSSDAQFPAFCLVQLLIRQGRLIVVGYFRKQEMQYWWPVNVAELARLQREVRDKLLAMGQHNAPECGEIVTITAIPTTGKAIPRVVVPRLDRWVDDEPQRLTRMCLSLMTPGSVDMAAACEDWQVMLEECQPSADAADGGPVPIAGMDALLGQFSALEQIVANAFDVGTVQTTIGGLVAQHRQYQKVTRRNDRDAELHGRLVRAVETLRVELEKLMPTLSETADPIDPPDPPAAAS
jgi:3',5'-cyclic AMP phosphodiesterase CpdA